MLEAGQAAGLQLWNDPLGQGLAEFDAPLVKRVDIPHDALGENAVFVQCHERTEYLRGQPLRQDRIGRAIPFKDTVRHKPIGCALGFDLVGRLAEGERLGLGQNVLDLNFLL